MYRGVEDVRGKALTTALYETCAATKDEKNKWEWAGLL